MLSDHTVWILDPSLYRRIQEVLCSGGIALLTVYTREEAGKNRGLHKYDIWVEGGATILQWTERQA